MWKSILEIGPAAPSCRNLGCDASGEPAGPRAGGAERASPPAPGSFCSQGGHSDPKRVGTSNMGISLGKAAPVPTFLRLRLLLSCLWTCSPGSLQCPGLQNTPKVPKSSTNSLIPQKSHPPVLQLSPDTGTRVRGDRRTGSGRGTVLEAPNCVRDSLERNWRIWILFLA